MRKSKFTASQIMDAVKRIEDGVDVLFAMTKQQPAFVTVFQGSTH